MARLITGGFEWGSASGDGVTAQTTGGTIVTSPVRSGTYAWQATTSGTQLVNLPFTAVSGRTYFLRAYVYIASGSPAGYVVFFGTVSNIQAFASLAADHSVQLGYWDGSATHMVGSATAPLSTGAWHRIELSQNISTAGTDSCGLVVDGTTVASTSGVAISTAVPTQIEMGGGVGGTVVFDDYALNDDQGASQNSYPGDGKVLLLLPISDNARNGWIAGGGGTTSLFDAVNNMPPVGVTTPQTNASAVTDATSSTTDNCDLNCTSYSTAGIGASDTITLVQAMCSHGEDIATGTKAGAIRCLSNPADSGDAAFNYGNDAGAVGTWPTNWFTSWGNPVYAPSVTLGTSPVVRLGKRTATTALVDVAAAGIAVEYIAAAPVGTPVYLIGSGL